MNRVYITASTVISSLGIGIEESLSTLESGKQTIHIPVGNEKFNKPYFPVRSNLNIDKDITLASKFTLKLMSIIEDKWINLPPLPVFFATSTGGIKETEEVYSNLFSTKKKFDLKGKHYFYDIYQGIKEKYKDKITDFYTFATACSSSGHSIMHAYRFIKKGIINKALVIGADALSITTMFGFDALKLVSQNGTRPLSKDRDGLTLGEGGGILLLESEPSSTPMAEVLGVSSNSDGFHITSPNPAGTQQKECILDAVKQANIDINEINYINAHGTGTPTNDEIEVNVIKSLFPSGVVMTSLKGFIGHTVGSSAIAELVIAHGMLKNKKIYQQKNIGEPIDNNYIPTKNIENIDVKYFLKNSFGFGGNNVSMIIRTNNDK